AQAARTIAERGVQLVGTAHGNTLENLMMNPTLADLIGGIQTVTLGDEEAKRRGTQKSILERMSPPTFGIVVEIQDWDKVAIHPDVSEAVDAILRGQPTATETRWLDKAGEVRVEREMPITSTQKTIRGKRLARENNLHKLYLFGINRGRLEQIVKERRLSLDIVNNLSDANLFITSKSYYRRRPQKVRDAEAANLPIYVLKSNTPPQIRQLLNTIYPTESTSKADSLRLALSEAEEAVSKVKTGQEAVELSPQSAYIRRLQHLIAKRNELSSQSTGKDSNRRVRIYKEGTKV
ncbi:unnamed protein product, partial [marine sediment metagenome]